MSDAWLKKLDKEELAAMIPPETLMKVAAPEVAMKHLTVRMAKQGRLGKKGAALRIAKTGAKPSQMAAKQASSWGSAIKEQIYLFLCTDDPKYKKAKDEIDKYKGSATLTIVSFIAAGVASVLGLAAAVVVPFVAIALTAILAIGKGAYCSVAKPKP